MQNNSDVQRDRRNQSVHFTQPATCAGQDNNSFGILDRLHNRLSSQKAGSRGSSAGSNEEIELETLSTGWETMSRNVIGHPEPLVQHNKGPYQVKVGEYSPSGYTAGQQSNATKKGESPSTDPRNSIPFYSSFAARNATSQSWKQFRIVLELLRRYILQITEYHADPEGRSLLVTLESDEPQIERMSRKPYVDNTITSSRYTIYNFLPRQLAFQFSKVANIYFLSVSILQMIPGWSTTGTYTTIVPLAVFICIAMAREGYDDIRRHRMDRAENNLRTTVMKYDHGNLGEVTVPWAQLKVGDIIKLTKDAWIPADIVLLRSGAENGAAYIETAALDGETNLKVKRAIPFIAQRCNERDLGTFHAIIHSESPNQDLYKYEGKCSCAGQDFPLTGEQIIYRGSILRNTTDILAVIIFTGEESKIRLNASKTFRTKRPTMQSRVNRVVVAIVLFVICLAIFCTCGYYIWHEDTEEALWYLAEANSISFMPIFVSFIILFNTMVPLSLYVSMEIVKLIQQILLQQDIDLYHEESNTPAEARTSTINEELGQISYIFTDKTGTLTDNEMVFRRMSVAGHAWLHDLDIQREAAQERPFLLHRSKRKQRVARHRSGMIRRESLPTAAQRRSTGHAFSRTSFGPLNHQPSTKNGLSGEDPPHLRTDLHTTMDLLTYIQDHPHTVFARRARLFLLSIALCHTAIPESTSGNSATEYSAASPDELALVTAAKELGYIMTDRDAHTVTLKMSTPGLHENAQSEVYKIHDIIEFSSVRKRMSVIVELPDGRFCLICKGADTFLLERMRLKELAKRKWLEVENIVKHRRSVEAEQIIARKSLARPSVSRLSMGGVSQLDTVRNLDEFLNSRRESRQYHEVQEEHPQMHAHYLRHSIAIGESTLPLARGRDALINDHLAGNDAAIFEQTFNHLHSFACEGLRVLLYGHRYLSAEEYHSWKKVYDEACTSFVDRQRKVEQAGELLETQLELTGATAIEDKLQDGVVPAIDKLCRAGIKLWMLTGDKRETAINIGHSAGLIKDYSTVIQLDHNDPNMAGYMAEKLLAMVDALVAHSVVVIDGASLAIIEDDVNLLALFTDLAVVVDTVICCRASPAQKAFLVGQVRNKIATSITLAIGDGANDIAMIKEAHVGIGITGKEGLQAARSSDYSIAQFRFLVKLLLVHGRWNYIR